MKGLFHKSYFTSHHQVLACSCPLTTAWVINSATVVDVASVALQFVVTHHVFSISFPRVKIQNSRSSERRFTWCQKEMKMSAISWKGGCECLRKFSFFVPLFASLLVWHGAPIKNSLYPWCKGGRLTTENSKSRNSRWRHLNLHCWFHEREGGDDSYSRCPDQAQSLIEVIHCISLARPECGQVFRSRARTGLHLTDF